MTIISLTVGALSTNCYIVVDETTRKTCVIDPGGDAQAIEAALADVGVRPQMILITHGHMDHFLAAARLKERYGCPVRMHQLETGYMQSAAGLRSPYSKAAFERFLACVSADLHDGDRVALGNTVLEAIEVPGHTAHSLCFYAEGDEVLFAGDTLFAGSIGRTDLYDGSAADLIRNIRNRLMVLPDTVRVLCGHGPETSIGEERQYNPFVGRRFR